MSTAFFIVAVGRGCAQTFRRPLPAFTPLVLYCQSTQSVPAARLPYRVKLSAGKRYAWCACGHSKKQPFCDGAHRSKAPSISPVFFTPNKDKAALLCACKQTKSAPYCDGSHLKVIFRDVVKAVKGIFK